MEDSGGQRGALPRSVEGPGRLRPLGIGVLVLAGVVTVGDRVSRPVDQVQQISEAARALREAVGERRFFEPRLSGGFQAARRRLEDGDFAGAPTLSGGTAREDWRILSAASLIKAIVGHDPDSRARASLGAAQLLLGESEESVRNFERALQDQPDDAAILSDLAAAYLVRGAAADRPDDVPRALEASARALAVNPVLLEAQFNHALALEAMELPGQAVRAWEAVLRAEPDAAWRDEGLRRLRALKERPVPDFGQMKSTIERALDGASERDLDVAVRANVGIARDLFDVELLPDFQRRASRARSLAGSLFRVTGDRDCLDAAEARAPPEEVERRARAARDASAAALKGEWDRVLEIAHGSSAQASDPVSLRLQLRALAAQFQRSVEDAAAGSERVARLASQSGYRDLEARAHSLLYMINGARGRWDESLANLRHSIQLYEGGLRPDLAADQRGALADYLDGLGERTEAWRNRLASIRNAAWYRDRSLGLVNFLFVGQFSADNGFPRAGIEVLNECREDALTEGPSRLPSDGASWFRTMGRVREVLRPGSGVADLREAARRLDRISDPTSLARNRGELLVARASVRPGRDPEYGASRRIEAAVEWLRARRAPYRLPELLVNLAEARRIEGRPKDAKRAASEAADLLETAALADKDLWLTQDLFAARTFEQLIQSDEAPEAALLSANRAFSLLARPGGPGKSRPSSLPRLYRNEALVAYFLGEARAWVWVLTADGLWMQPLDASAPVDLQKCLWDTRIGAEDRAPECLPFRRSFVEPLRYRLRAAERVVIIPHRALAGIPTALLRRHFEETLGRRYVMSYAPDLAFASVRQKGGPARRVGILTGARSAGAARLDQAADEPEAIRRLYPKEIAVATESTVKEALALLSRSDVIHVAAHGFSSPLKPTLARLLLDDGDLHAARLRQLDLRAVKIAILLACDAENEPLSAAPGNYSLARALLEGGAQSVIAAVGEVSDADARQWSEILHRELATSGRTSLAFDRLIDSWPRESPPIYLSYYAGFSNPADGGSR